MDVMQRLCQKGLDPMMLDAGQGRVAEHQQVYKDQLLLDPTNWSIKNIIVGTIYVYISRHKCIVRIYMSFIRMLSRLNFPKITRKKKKQQQQQKKKNSPHRSALREQVHVLGRVCGQTMTCECRSSFSSMVRHIGLGRLHPADFFPKVLFRSGGL